MKAPIIIIALLSAIIAGCSTTQPVVTPARVEAVIKLGVYVAAKNLVDDGKAAECQRALTGLRVLNASESLDIASVAAALSAAGIRWLETPEGTMAVGVAVVFFNDVFGEATALGDTLAVPVMRGAIGGLELALATQTRSGRSIDMTARLEAEAAATRPRSP